MCRLLGWVYDDTTSVEDVLGSDGLAGFTSLTRVHADGWGMAWREGDATRTITSPESADADPTYDEHVRRPVSAAGMLHLRWATGGLPVASRNTHPFFEGDYAFAHNGHVSPIDKLEGLLTAECRARLVGDTDSERYFRYVLQCVEETGDLEQGLRRALATMVEEFPSSSLNALMLTPTHLVAIHVNSRAASPVEGLRALFDDEEDVPPRHLTEYFAMDYRADEHGIAVISSGLDEEGWTPVDDDTAVMIDLETRAVTRIDPVLAMQEDAEEIG
ncbi:MAG TPA: class II glutamine amidotransferase [Nocardioides sp.]